MTSLRSCVSWSTRPVPVVVADIIEGKYPALDGEGRAPRVIEPQKDVILAKILRRPLATSREDFDLIIIGGGIHGVMLSLEASAHGVKSLLVEKADFGHATSFNSLRILHGGLRYLQSMDLPRFRESVHERRWFMQCFPDLIAPLPCLMPLYGTALHRTGVLAIALRLNDFLSARRNDAVRDDIHLPDGRVVSAGETERLFPLNDADGLQGGAIWYDAFMPNSQRVLTEALRWSCSLGGMALNYVEATKLLVGGGRVAGIEATDQETGESFEYRAGTVINAAGPWCPAVTDRFDVRPPNELAYSLAWNVLFDREALSSHALAVNARKPGAQTLFLCPWNGRLYAGTKHLPPAPTRDDPVPGQNHIDGFIAEINDAVPGLDLQTQEIRGVFSGFLPARHGAKNSLAVRETFVDHGRHGGPAGLFTVVGIKFTTARRVAEKALRLAMPESAGSASSAIAGAWDSRPLRGLDASVDPSAVGWADDLNAVIADESVMHLDDLVMRRTTLWDSPEKALMLAPKLCSLFDWDQDRSAAETERLRTCLSPVRTGLEEREATFGKAG